MSRNDYTGLFYSQPSFTEGLARVLDVGGTFDEDHDDLMPVEGDSLALACDWYAVGADLYRAIAHSTVPVRRQVADGKLAGSR